MIVLRTKHYAAADFINNAAKFAKKRQSLINRATAHGEHDLAKALENATDEEFANYLRHRDKISAQGGSQGQELRNYISGVKQAREDYNQVFKNGEIVYSKDGKNLTPEFYAAKKIVGKDARTAGYNFDKNGNIQYYAGGGTIKQHQGHLGQSESLRENLDSYFHNAKNDGDYRNNWTWDDKATNKKTHYIGDISGSDKVINALDHHSGAYNHYQDFLPDNGSGLVNKIIRGEGAEEANNALMKNVGARQAKEAQIKAQQEAAKKAAEEAAAKKAQQEADEKARREAAEARKRAEQEEEEQRRIRQQQQQEEFEKREEKRQQEQRDIQQRAEERSQKRGLYTGLGIAGGTAVLGGGIYALSRNNNNNNNNNNNSR